MMLFSDLFMRLHGEIVKQLRNNVSSTCNCISSKDLENLGKYVRGKTENRH